jgi:hypothetical protein
MTDRTLIVALVAATSLVGCSPQDAAPMPDPQGVTSQAGGFHARWQPSVDPLPLNESFNATLWLSSSADGAPIEGAHVSVDCRMPAHRHGMLQEVEITDEGQGRYQVLGLLCHMVGHWVLHVDLTRGAVTERAQFDLIIE